MTRREFEVKDPGVIRDILDGSKFLHLGLVDDGMPYVVPMNYGYKMEDGKLTLYLHSAVKGYKLDVIAKNPTCCFEMDWGVEPFEGKIPCQYGITYYSLMGRGKAVLVEDVKEKEAAMTLLMKAQTGKDFEFNERLVSIVSVIRIDVSEYTAKHRPLPGQEPNQK
ncbi:MAG: pyridoxamine 5'-phosphate oxidase family protein [Candidatus Faecousia sp.]|nr:pyridoxamine 5'-phosphate oxidase family protein [Bacillota bacterium]MDY4755863.1 pyridoxamine 5'-phosphate oxidase family protein [Candidatus Faecousia sp.]MDY6161682.1 pyridoxamine 5'-phosphate oxidase family protein [Candidatus Faecousia sp.]